MPPDHDLSEALSQKDILSGAASLILYKSGKLKKKIVNTKQCTFKLCQAISDIKDFHTNFCKISSSTRNFSMSSTGTGIRKGVSTSSRVSILQASGDTMDMVSTQAAVTQSSFSLFVKNIKWSQKKRVQSKKKKQAFKTSQLAHQVN